MESNLSKLFDDAFQVYEHLQTTSWPSNSVQYQKKVGEGVRLLEEATQLVNELSLFSSNESIEEISTKNLKYLLLPAILGDLTLKMQQIDRNEVIRTAEIYFNDFIQRLNDYQVCDIDIKRSDDGESVANKSESLESAVRSRNDKIAKYKETKLLENKLKEFKEQLSGNKDSFDEEIMRDYYLTHLKRWLNQAVDELNSIDIEKPILQHMSQIKTLDKDKTHANNRRLENKKSLHPIIITRNEIQKKVYGLGYPSIPTVTIEDFISQKIDEGSLAVTNPNIYSNSLIDWADNPEKKTNEDEREEENKEKLIENDDEKQLRKAREWDDWKDGKLDDYNIEEEKEIGKTWDEFLRKHPICVEL